VADDAPIDVTVSIVNHNNRDAVLAGLAALHDDPGRRARVELLVVDNVSHDGSAAAFRAAFADVEVIQRTERAGFGANHNVALRRARGRHVLLLNDDTVVAPGAIDALAAQLDAHPDVAIASPTVLTPDGHAEPTLWRRPTPWGDVVGALAPGHAHGLDLHGPDPQPIGWATGCALLVRRDAVLAVGGFDERYFMYSEEIDLATRLAAAGLAVHWVPAARVVHQGQASTVAWSPARAVEMARGRRRYWRTHYSTAGALVARTAVSAQFAALALLTLARRRDPRPLVLQAVGCWTEPGRPGLREAAAAFNRSRAGG
jgi:N-acetylglucosaminyl-diphospho-decaprenol L-rhamnosyltransferase